ncbi:MAG: cytochrome c [Hyphomicrobiales bacterium]|nr:cytochrome c [Hyphomicrobiales bacterium]MCP4999016.1 cytochrome c [Hyphomicrobiales bacterium]
MSAIRLAMLIGTLFFTLMTTNGFAQGDAAAGEELARKWCARCHDVEPGGPFKLHPPSFASIAVYRSGEQIYGRILFPPLHSNMPQIGYILTPDNVDDLAAYIGSLEAQ